MARYVVKSRGKINEVRLSEWVSVNVAGTWKSLVCTVAPKTGVATSYEMLEICYHREQTSHLQNLEPFSSVQQLCSWRFPAERSAAWEQSYSSPIFLHI
jgi:hypothetical protein